METDEKYEKRTKSVKKRSLLSSTQAEQDAYSMDRFAKRMFQEIGGAFTTITNGDNACGHNPTHTVRTFANPSVKRHNLGTLRHADNNAYGQRPPVSAWILERQHIHTCRLHRFLWALDYIMVE